MAIIWWWSSLFAISYLIIVVILLVAKHNDERVEHWQLWVFYIAVLLAIVFLGGIFGCILGPWAMWIILFCTSLLGLAITFFGRNSTEMTDTDIVNWMLVVFGGLFLFSLGAVLGCFL